MKLYAVFRDGELYRASFRQNVPFYDTLGGARKALQSATNKSSLPHHLKDASEKVKQDYLAKQKCRFDIREFELVGERKCEDGN